MPSQRKLRFETLEQRRVLALVVDTLRDEFDGSVSDGDISLRDAIAAAAEGESIQFLPGLTGLLELDPSLGSIRIEKGLTILSDGQVTIDGGGGEDGIVGNGDGLTVLTIDDGDDSRLSSVHLSGLAITGGDAATLGGGVFNSEHLRLNDSKVIANHAGRQGGGIYSSGPVTANHSSIEYNTAGVSGGGLLNTESLITISETSVSHNAAAEGGGITNVAGSLLVSGSIFRDNSAGSQSRTCAVPPCGGGAVSNGTVNHAATLVIENSLLEGNRASGRHNSTGGAIHSWGDVSLTGSAVVNNHADARGGGIEALMHRRPTSLDIINSTFVGNSSREAGGLYTREGTVSIVSSTFSDNTATDTIPFTNKTSADFYILSSDVYLSSSVFASPGGDYISTTYPGQTSGGYNAFRDLYRTSEGFYTDSVFGEPHLGPLANNGGWLPTMSLLPTSPLIDSGDPGVTVGEYGPLLAYDQRGGAYERVVGGRVDIGAYEAQASPRRATADYNGDGAVDAADYTMWRDAMQHASAVVPLAGSDGDGDGSVNAIDYDVWTSHYGFSWPDFSRGNELVGDYDSSLVVNASDYRYWSSSYGLHDSPRADGNGDGRIDAADYTIWRDNSGLSYGFDYGDAPEPYKTIYFADGARHIAIGSTIGLSRDTEPDGLPSSSGPGDGADEDGVLLGVMQAGQLGATVEVLVQGGPAMLDAWIDFNNDGSLNGVAEQIFRAVEVGEGWNILHFNVPSDAANGAVWSRFRLSDHGKLGVSGVAPDGEIEDHTVYITSPTQSSGEFGSQEQIATESQDSVTSVATADIDGDGDYDVIAASFQDDKVSWYENIGGSRFAERVISTSIGGPKDVFVDDIDGDGDADLLAAAWRDDTVLWYENNGTQQFTERVIARNARYASHASSADLDGDGDRDILAVYDNRFVWYENVAEEEYSERILSGSGAPAAYSVADATGDGELDIVVAYSDWSSLIVWMNDGQDGFGFQTVPTSNDGNTGVAVSDLDGDGDLDIASVSKKEDKVVWHERLESGEYVEHVVSSSVDGPQSVLAADYDGDGDFDLLVSSRYDDKIVWYDNVDGRLFAERLLAAENNPASSLAVTDLDGDGDLDVVGSSSLGRTVFWYENGVATPAAESTFYSHMYAQRSESPPRRTDTSFLGLGSHELRGIEADIALLLYLAAEESPEAEACIDEPLRIGEETREISGKDSVEDVAIVFSRPKLGIN